MFNFAKKMFNQHQQLPVLDESIAYTPDVARLEQFYLQNVFIYNEFMRGCHQFKPVMEGNVRKLGAAFTRQDNFTLWKKNLGDVSEAFAMELFEEHRFGNSSFFGPPARLLGHIYTMRPYQVMALDKCMLNGVAFKRKRIKVDIPYSLPEDMNDPAESARLRRVESINVWAYIGNMDYWSNQMDPKRQRFSPVSTYSIKGEDNPYYFYAQRLEASRK